MSDDLPRVDFPEEGSRGPSDESRIAGVSRRRFMASVGTLAGLVLLPACGPSQESLALGRRLIEVLPTGDAWRRVGEIYLQSDPPESGVEALIDSLLSDLGWDPAAGTAEELETQVTKRVRRDFHEGHTVEVQGWVLSATEVRLAAIAAQV